MNPRLRATSARSSSREATIVSLQNALLGLDKDGPEQQAVEAGEIDAIIDYSSNKVILFPAARRALREVATDPAEIGSRLRTACWLRYP